MIDASSKLQVEARNWNYHSDVRKCSRNSARRAEAVGIYTRVPIWTMMRLTPATKGENNQRNRVRRTGHREKSITKMKQHRESYSTFTDLDSICKIARTDVLGCSAVCVILADSLPEPSHRRLVLDALAGSEFRTEIVTRLGDAVSNSYTHPTLNHH